MKKKAKEKNRQIFVSSRRGVIIVALIAIMVLMINLISASYSWFTPQEDKKRSMAYAFDGNVRSESCDEMNTFVGIKQTSADLQNNKYKNQIIYSTTEATGNQSVAAGATKYFKTEIINSDTKSASDISLFIKSLPASTLAVTYPGNSVHEYGIAQTDCPIVRDAYVKKYVATDVNGPGKLEIEWFVTNNGSSAITVNLNYLYLVYN